MTVVSGHQPAYLPWLGLLHKASLCDVFVYMDDVQFLDRDFNHRNRVVTPSGQVVRLTVPVDRKGSESRLLKDIRIARDTDWQREHGLTLRSCYGKAPYFDAYWPFFQWLYFEQEWEMLSELNLAMLRQLFEWFDLEPELIVASQHDFTGKKSDLVLEHARTFGASTVVTGVMGRDYIRLDDFAAAGVDVLFQDYSHPEYAQGWWEFVPRLACVDLLFRHGPKSPAIAFAGNIGKGDVA